jgi:hypothetical protein
MFLYCSTSAAMSSRSPAGSRARSSNVRSRRPQDAARRDQGHVPDGQRRPERRAELQRGAITGPPNELVAPIHNRMPVILPRDAWCRWFGEADTDAGELLAPLGPYPAELMRAYRRRARRERAQQRAQGQTLF